MVLVFEIDAKASKIKFPAALLNAFVEILAVYKSVIVFSLLHSGMGSAIRFVRERLSML